MENAGVVVPAAEENPPNGASAADLVVEVDEGTFIYLFQYIWYTDKCPNATNLLKGQTS